MLNLFGNNTLVPNGYVYTSHTGSKYVFLEGLWLHNSSMQLVDPTAYSNMYVCAQKQILEHNSKSEMKIGSTYIVEGQECTFVGGYKFINENNIIMEVSRDYYAISDFKQGDPDNLSIPNWYCPDKINEWNSVKKVWKMKGDSYITTNPKHIEQLNDKAREKIAEYNQSHPDLPINSTIEFHGDTYYWNGTDWTQNDDYGRVSPNDLVGRYFTKFIEHQRNGTKEGEDSAPAGKESQVQQDKAQPDEEPPAPENKPPATSMKKGTSFIQDGKKFVYDGNGQFVTDTGEVYPQDKAQKIIAHYDSQQARQEQSASTDLSTQKMKKGTSFTQNGKKFVYDGNGKFVTDTGEVYPQKQTEQILAKYNAEQAQKEQESKKPEDEKIKNDVDSRVDDTSTATPEDKHEEEKADQEKEIDDNDAKQDDAQENDKISGLAAQIKAAAPDVARKIEVLLTRADKLSLMAADILLAGNADEVKKIIQSLNSRDK